jgi:hypothetical protein
MVGHDEMGCLADEELGFILKIPPLLQGINLLAEDVGIDYDPTADNAFLPGMENARGNQVKDKLLIPHH